MSPALQCWHCGADLQSIPLPLSRRAVCPACESDLHVCRMCTQLDITAAKSCREPTVDEVRDKLKANFCDLFSPDPRAHQRDPDRDARQAQQELAAAFGLQGEPAETGDRPDARTLLDQRKKAAEQAHQQLQDLFGIDEK